MKKILLSLLLALTASVGTAQTVGDAIYFYRNDGGFNAFFRADIDSITYTTIAGSNSATDGMMVQNIHTPDSTYEIPLSAIDSVSFVNPETILQPDVVRMDESMLSYLLAVDGMMLTFSTTMPPSLRPKKGDLLLSVIPSNTLLSNGFAGRVTSVSETAGTLLVVCSLVDDVSDIFVQLIGVERIGKKYPYITCIKYEDKNGFKGSYTKPLKESGEENEPSFDAQISVNGSVMAGGKLGLSLGTIDFFGGYLRAQTYLHQ